MNMRINARLGRLETSIHFGRDDSSPEECMARLYAVAKALPGYNEPGQIGDFRREIISRVVNIDRLASSPHSSLQQKESCMLRRLRRLAHAVPGLWPDIIVEGVPCGQI